jgi:hypothetical protein
MLPDLWHYISMHGKLASKIGSRSINLSTLRDPNNVDEKENTFEFQPAPKGTQPTDQWLKPIIIANLIATSMIIMATIHLKIKLLSVVGMSLTHPGLAMAQLATSQRSWNFFQPPQPTTIAPAIYQLILDSLSVVREIDTIEIIQLLTTIIIAGVLWFHAHQMWLKKFESTINLELGTAKMRVSVPLLTIPHHADYYTVRADKILSSVSIQRLWFPKIILNYENVCLRHRHAHISYTLPTAVSINWYTAYKIYHIVQNRNSFYYLLFARNSKGLNKILPVITQDSDTQGPIPRCDEY